MIKKNVLDQSLFNKQSNAHQNKYIGLATSR